MEQLTAESEAAWAAGDAEAALPLLQRIVDQTRARSDPRSPELVRALVDVAVVALQSGEPRVALPYLDEALAASEAWSTDDHVERGRALHAYGGACHLLGRDDEAIVNLEAALTIQRQSSPEDVDATLATLVGLHARRGDRAAAEAAAVEILGRSPEVPPTPARADVQTILAWGMERTGDRAAIEQAYGRAIATWQAVGDPTGTAGAWRALARARQEAGDLEGTRDAWLAALQALGDTGLDRRVEALRELSDVWGDLGRPEEARVVAEQAVALRADALATAPEPEAAVALVRALATLSNVHARAGHHALAAGRAEEALALARATRGPSDPLTWSSATNLAVSLQALGRNEEAGAALRVTLAAQRAALPPTDPDLLFTIEVLARVDTSAGVYDEARSLLEEAVAARRARDDPALAETLNRLGTLLTALGDDVGAERAFEESLGIRRVSVSARDTRLASALNNLATARAARGDHAGAEALLRECLGIEQAVLGPDHPRVARTWNNLGLVRRDQGDLASAKEMLHRSLSIRLATLGPDHPDVATVTANLALVLRAEGDLEGARIRYEEALRIWIATLGPDHPTVGQALLGLATTEHMLGHVDAARRHADEAMTVASAALEWIDGLSEREALAWGTRLRSIHSLWLAVHDRPDDDDSAWRHVLAWRGVATRRLQARAAEARDTDDPEVARIVAELNATRRELARLAWSEHDLDAATRTSELGDRVADKERLERSLAARVAGLEGAEPTSEDVCAALGRTDTLVAFVRYDRGAEPAYAAFVVDRTCRPVRVGLGPAAPIDASVDRWRRLARDPVFAARADREGVTLAASLWAPIQARLPSTTRRVVVAPDGPLALLPFGALPTASFPRRYLIEDVTLALVDHPFDLVTPRSRAGRGALIVSDVGYGPDAGASCAGFAPLPGAAVEGEAVAAAWARHGRGPTERLSGGAATEQALERDAPGHALVHLATHGVVDGSCVPGTDPMLGAALALAGINEVHLPGARFDGVLTAADVAARLDLDGARLVVLSACDTGGGVPTAGEGVLGLRRAFLAARAGAVMTSLWTIPDDGTAAVMGAFYGHLLPRRLDAPAAALGLAQRELLDVSRGPNGIATSFDWAAFVVSGIR